MSVDLIPILVDETLFVQEITRLRQRHSPEQLDSGEVDFKAGLAFDESAGQGQYSYAKLRPYKNTRWCLEADSMRFQLLNKSRETLDWNVGCNADALFQFFGVFFCSLSANNPFNEFGFHHSTIINPANSLRLHQRFQRINFELLQPVFHAHCQPRVDAGEYTYIRSFDDLVKYAQALDGLLAQAIEKKQMLYVFGS